MSRDSKRIEKMLESSLTVFSVHKVTLNHETYVLTKGEWKMIDIQKLLEYKKDVNRYMRERLQCGFKQDSLIEICAGINDILVDWTGNTYVGRKKEKEVEKTYQVFFELMHEFIEFCFINSEKINEMESSLADYVIYTGTVYRYLGIADFRNYQKKLKVEPEYNEIFVSWSKSEKNLYIESKLSGPMTWMKAEIEKPEFGIDIHGFERWCERWFGGFEVITRGEEKEVVFPTLKKNILEIKYFG